MDLDLRQLFRLARRWWWLLLLGPLIAGATARTLSQRQAPLYSATAKLQVTPAQSTNPNDYSAIQVSQSLASTYQQMITARPVLAQVVQSLHLPYGVDELQKKVSASTIDNTYLLKVSVSDTDPEQAARIANAVAQTFAAYTAQQATSQQGSARKALDDQINVTRSQISDLQKQIQQLQETPKASDPDTQARLASLRATLDQQQMALNQLLVSANQLDLATASAQSRVSVFEPAVAPSAPYAPRVMRTTLLAIFAGLMIAVGAVVLLEYLDNTVKADSDFPSLAGSPLLATIGRLPKLRSGQDQLFVRVQPRSSPAEAMRLLRTNLEFAAAANEIASLAITSPGVGEGKSTIAANLGLTVAQAGFSAAIIDADLRRPSQHRIFDVHNERGLTTLLTHPQQPWRWASVNVAPNLVVVPSGPLPPNPADLLSLERFRQLLADIQAETDVVILDTPPVLAVSDALAVATNVDGVILVSRAGHTRREALRHAAATLQKGAVRLVGVVMNQQTGHGADGYYYYSGYYGSDPKPPASTNAPTGTALNVAGGNEQN